MNRRDFIKMLAAVPALTWLKPEVPKVEPDVFFDIVENYSPSLAYIEAGKRGFEGFAKGLEDSRNQTGFRPSLEIQPNGALYIRGDFLEENLEEYRERIRVT